MITFDQSPVKALHRQRTNHLFLHKNYLGCEVATKEQLLACLSNRPQLGGISALFSFMQAHDMSCAPGMHPTSSRWCRSCGPFLVAWCIIPTLSGH